MKNMIWMTGLLILPLLSFSQEKAKITIDAITIDVNGMNSDIGNIFEEMLILNEKKEILIYQKNGISYGAEFTYKKKGNRIKLVRRTWAMKDAGKKKYSKQKKEVQFLKTSNPGILKGKSVENIVLDKKKMESINVIFKFELKYMGVE
jgi:hypothetical protein